MDLTHSLSEDQKAVLELGLGFAPTANHPPHPSQGWHPYLQRFRRHYRTLTAPPQPTPEYATELPRHAAIPDIPSDHHVPVDQHPAPPPIENFLQAIHDQLAQLTPAPFRRNLPPHLRSALRSLSTNQSLVIRKADKGNQVVVQTKDDYLERATSHLADADTYQQLPDDETPSLVSDINSYITYLRSRRVIPYRTFKQLTLDPTQVRTQRIYFPLKTHKTPHAIRPVVSGVSGPTEKLSGLADRLLRPALAVVPSLLTDSRQLINTLETTTLPPDTLLATLDVKSLYEVIPQQEGIDIATRRYMQSTMHPPIPPHVMKTMLKFILNHNIFEFNAHTYKQIRGVAMGTRMAPTFANLFMADVEEDLLRQASTRFPVPLLWKRYIDDIFLLWPGSLQQLCDFVDFLNTGHPTINFTLQYNMHSIDFLDMNVYKGPRFQSSGTLDIQPHYKPTNTFSYLHFSSSHPPHVHAGLVTGELIRLLRLSSSPQTYSHHVALLHAHLRGRGYPKKLLTRLEERHPYQKRQAVLQGNTNKKTLYKDIIRLHCNYHPAFQPSKIRKAMKGQHDWPFQSSVAFLHNRTLASYLVKSKIT